MWPCGLRSPPPTLYPLKVRPLIAGQEAEMEGFSGHPRPTPKTQRVRLTQHPLAPALEKCSVKLWKGGMAKVNTGLREGLMKLVSAVP